MKFFVIDNTDAAYMFRGRDLLGHVGVKNLTGEQQFDRSPSPLEQSIKCTQEIWHTFDRADLSHETDPQRPRVSIRLAWPKTSDLDR
jgi:hypothetical protein